MIDYILTGLVIFILALIVFRSICIDEKTEWMSISYTTALKAIACIVVVLVHIPSEYGNKLQDMVGSFAYIGVTIFSMISAYGCRTGVEKSNNYLKFFWKNRLLNLLLPVLVFNLLAVPFEMLVFQNTSFKFSRYVQALIIAYFIFWSIWKMKFISEKYKDIVISGIVLICSLITYFTELDIFSI